MLSKEYLNRLENEYKGSLLLSRSQRALIRRELVLDTFDYQLITSSTNEILENKDD